MSEAESEHYRTCFVLNKKYCVEFIKRTAEYLYSTFYSVLKDGQNEKSSEIGKRLS